MTIEEMNLIKKERGYTNRLLADLSGVPLSTVNKVLSGATKSPRRTTIRALSAVLQSGVSSHLPTPISQQSSDAVHKSVDYLEIANKERVSILNEPAPAYKTAPAVMGYAMGPYTLEDYLALPDDDRKELIDGIFYDMSAPTIFHQHIGGLVFYQLMSYVEKKGGKCMPFMSPVDVQIDMTDKTVVQPDVLIICNPKDLIKNQRVFGAPDYIMEVLSPSTRSKDLTIKLNKYYQSGVREYWAVDPASRKVLVYDLEHDSYIPEIYDFAEKVPVLIWDKKTFVDFSGIENIFD